MYVLLNLKDGSRLSEVVQLLFSHGHTAVSVAETIEDLCPRCECLTKRRERTLEQSQRDSPTPSTSFAPETKSQKAGVHTEEIDSAFDSRLANSDTPSEEVEEVVIEPERQQAKTKPATPPHPIAEVKEEEPENNHPAALFQEAKCLKSEVTSNAEQFNIASAIELLCTTAGPSVSAPDDLDLDVRSTERPSAQKSKRIARIEELGLETFQCQLCKKQITRQGQHANLVNHLSRHARLHASKKQYYCPVCRASFSRRYLAFSHVREAHSKHGYLEPVDYGRELREEYRALLEMCFPGASSRRKTAPPPPASGDAAVRIDRGDMAGMPAYKDELSRLLE